MKFRPTLLALGLGILATAASTVAGADGNPEQGKKLAYTCLGCHGVPSYKNAYPSYSVPRLGGQHASYIAAALKQYSGGDRSHATMHAQATTLNDQDRADIGAYLHGAPLAVGQQVGTPPQAVQTCAACHGTLGSKSLTEEYPVLAGQYADYIVNALKEYKSGKRKNPVMAGIVAGLKEEDFPALALFFSQQQGLCGSDVITKQGKCR